MSNTPLKLAVDGNEANVKNRVGSNVFAYELLVAMEKAAANVEEYEITVLLSTQPQPDLPTSRTGWSYLVLTPEPLWTQCALPIHLFLHKKRYQVFFTPGHYAPRLSSVPYVSSVMDLAFLKYPEQFKAKDLVQLRDWTKYSVLNSRKVIAISQSTARDVIKTYHRRPSDVVVVYPAVTPLKLKYSPLKAKVWLKKLKIRPPFLLYVGTIQPRKNILRLVEAFEVLCRKQASLQTGSGRVTLPQLVLAGKVGWLANDTLKRIEASAFKDAIILTGYISEEQKMMLYKQAAGSILVGLYEGFGIPPLESLQLGTVPVVSNTSSLPEVVGKAGILVHPEMIASIAEGLQRVLSLNPKEKARLVKLGQHQVTTFSWEKSAQKVLAVLKKVAQE